MMENEKRKISKKEKEKDKIKSFNSVKPQSHFEDEWHAKVFSGSSMVKNLPANAVVPGWISGSRRSPGEGNDNSLQYSCLENSMDRGAWWATVHDVAKSQTQLSTHTHRTKRIKLILHLSPWMGFLLVCCTYFSLVWQYFVPSDCFEIYDHILTLIMGALLFVPKVKVLVIQLYPTLCDPMDCSPPGSSVHGILQARILEWVAMSLFREPSWPWVLNLGLLHHRQILYCLNHQGSLTFCSRVMLNKWKKITQ